MPGPLHGVRVLEFTLVVAGPMSGVLLSDLGADVIKVEPPGGESTRQSRAVIPDESKLFQAFNRGKRDIVVDLQQPEGREVIYRLMPSVDVVVANYRYGVPKKLGIDYETLKQYRPDLIYVESTGFGTRGELSTRGCSDVVAQAYSGIMAGDQKVADDGAPIPASFGAPADYATAMASAMGVCAALFNRSLTGKGQRINTSLLRTGVWLQSHNVNHEPVTDALFDDVTRAKLDETRAAGGSYPELIEVRQEGRFTGGLYYGGYAAKDGGIILGALTKLNRDGFRRVLGLEDEPSDQPGYDILDPENQRLAEHFMEVMRAKMRERTVDEWIEIFDAQGLPAAPVNFPEEIRLDEQVVAEGIFVDLEHDVTGPQSFVGPVLEMSETPTSASGAAPPLARDTRGVMLDAGYNEAEVDSLIASGAVVQAR
ncbi:MAG: CoA transferase [Chloroflexota bacterium]|nr:CoA transferase [Chloroflexota bacterium]